MKEKIIEKYKKYIIGDIEKNSKKLISLFNEKIRKNKKRNIIL